MNERDLLLESFQQSPPARQLAYLDRALRR